MVGNVLAITLFGRIRFGKEFVGSMPDRPPIGGYAEWTGHVNLLPPEGSFDISTKLGKLDRPLAQFSRLGRLAASLLDNSHLSHHPLIRRTPMDRFAECFGGGGEISVDAVSLKEMQLLGTDHSIDRRIFPCPSLRLLEQTLSIATGLGVVPIGDQPPAMVVGQPQHRIG